MTRTASAVVIALVSVAGCSPQSRALKTDSEGVADARLEGSWQLARADGVAAAGDRSERFVVTFAAGKVRGRVACNHFSGPYRVRQGRLETALSQTLLACARDTPEDHYAMQAVGGGMVAIGSETLRLETASGSVFEFRRLRRP